MDHYVGALLEGLKARGFLDETLLAVTADHGQNLSGNGKLAFRMALMSIRMSPHIPLIIRGYGLPVPKGRVVSRRYAMSGLAPTLMKALGRSDVLGHGRDFFSALRPGPVWDTEGWPTRPQWPIFMEATRPYTDTSATVWNNLDNHRAVRLGDNKLYRNPKSPQNRDRYSQDTPTTMKLVMDQLLTDWDADAPPYRLNEMEEKTRQPLEALGYVESSSK